MKQAIQLEIPFDYSQTNPAVVPVKNSHLGNKNRCFVSQAAALAGPRSFYYSRCRLLLYYDVPGCNTSRLML